MGKKKFRDQNLRFCFLRGQNAKRIIIKRINLMNPVDKFFLFFFSFLIFGCACSILGCGGFSFS